MGQEQHRPEAQRPRANGVPLRRDGDSTFPAARHQPGLEAGEGQRMGSYSWDRSPQWLPQPRRAALGLRQPVPASPWGPGLSPAHPLQTLWSPVQTGLEERPESSVSSDKDPCPLPGHRKGHGHLCSLGEGTGHQRLAELPPPHPTPSLPSTYRRINLHSGPSGQKLTG